MSSGGYNQASAGKGGAPNAGQVYNPGQAGGSPGKGGMNSVGQPALGAQPNMPGNPINTNPNNAGGTTGTGQNPMGPNAFETGLNAQNNAMDFYSGQMAGGNQQIMDMIKDLSSGGVAMPMGAGASFAGPAYQMKVPGQDLYSYNPAMAEGQSYQAAQLSDQDISQYMNPYTQSVIDSSISDLDRARQTALNGTGVAATRGGAFGGDRHGIMEAQNNRDYMDSVARTSSQLRNQGFMNAQNAAMGDVNAQNQALASNAAMAQQANMANAAAQNARDQYVGSTANANAMAAEQAALQSATQMAATGGSNASIQAANIAQANKQAALQAMLSMQGMQFDAANQLYGMGNDRFNMGQDALDAMGDVGGQIDAQNQSLIDAQRRDFEKLTGAPQDQYNQMLQALSALSGGGTQSSSYNPGMFDYLKAGAGMFGMGKG